MKKILLIFGLLLIGLGLQAQNIRAIRVKTDTLYIQKAESGASDTLIIIENGKVYYRLLSGVSVAYADSSGLSGHADTSDYATTAAYADSAGLSGYADSTGYSTATAYSDSAAVSGYADTSGYATKADTANNVATLPCNINIDTIDDCNADSLWILKHLIVPDDFRVTFGDDTAGAGAKLMWIPSKYSLLAGRTTGINFNYDSIGLASFNFGENNSIIGNGSGGFGSRNRIYASSSQSFVAGRDNVISGNICQFALGDSNSVTGQNGTAIGRTNTVTSLCGTAIGAYHNVSGFYSLAQGSNATASGNFSVAMGANTTASGLKSMATGSATVASAENSFSAINMSQAIAQSSASIGDSTIAGTFSHFVCGMSNDTTGLGTWNAVGKTLVDPIFTIGNGDYTLRTNAMQVLKNGNVGIGYNNPNRKLMVNGSGYFNDSLQIHNGIYAASPMLIFSDESINMLKKNGTDSAQVYLSDTTVTITAKNIVLSGTITGIPEATPEISDSIYRINSDNGLDTAYQITRVVANSGADTYLKYITPAANGTTIKLMGTDNTGTVTLTDGQNIALAGAVDYTLKDYYNIELTFLNGYWTETGGRVAAESHPLMNFKYTTLGDVPAFTDIYEWNDDFNSIVGDTFLAFEKSGRTATLYGSLAMTNFQYTGKSFEYVSFSDSLTSLQVINFGGNNIQYVTIPATLTSLQAVVFAANSITTMYIPSTLTALTTLNISNNALTQEVVDAILESLDISGVTTCNIDLSGGTNASPTGGLLNPHYLSLVAKGNTVNIN